MFLSSTTPKLDEIQNPEQFGQLIGFGCSSVEDMLVEVLLAGGSGKNEIITRKQHIIKIDLQ